MGEQFSFVINISFFSDPEGEHLTLGVALASDGGALPTWMGAQEDSQGSIILSGRPVEKSSYALRVTATDPHGAQADDVFTVFASDGGSSSNNTGGSSTLTVVGASVVGVIILLLLVAFCLCSFVYRKTDRRLADGHVQIANTAVTQPTAIARAETLDHFPLSSSPANFKSPSNLTTALSEIEQESDVESYPDGDIQPAVVTWSNLGASDL